MKTKKTIALILSALAMSPVFAQEYKTEIQTIVEKDQIWTEFKQDSLDRLHILYENGVDKNVPASVIKKMDHFNRGNFISSLLFGAAFSAGGFYMNANRDDGTKKALGNTFIGIGASLPLMAAAANHSSVKRYRDIAAVLEAAFTSIKNTCVDQGDECEERNLESFLMHTILSYDRVKKQQEKIDHAEDGESDNVVTGAARSVRSGIKSALLLPFIVVANSESAAALNGNVSSQRNKIYRRSKELKREENDAIVVKNQEAKVKRIQEDIERRKKRLEKRQ